MLGDQHGDALEEDRLGYTGAGDLVAARAEAELARPHHRLVGDSSGEVFVDFDVGGLCLSSGGRGRGGCGRGGGLRRRQGWFGGKGGSRR